MLVAVDHATFMQPIADGNKTKLKPSAKSKFRRTKDADQNMTCDSDTGVECIDKVLKNCKDVIAAASKARKCTLKEYNNLGIKIEKAIDTCLVVLDKQASDIVEPSQADAEAQRQRFRFVCVFIDCIVWLWAALVTSLHPGSLGYSFRCFFDWNWDQHSALSLNSGLDWTGLDRTGPFPFVSFKILSGNGFCLGRDHQQIPHD